MKNKVKEAKSVKPVLVKVGRHYINPDDVAAIREVKVKVREVDEFLGQDDDGLYQSSPRRKTMYVIDMKSNPNPTYAIWAEKNEVVLLLEQFNIKG